MERCLTSASSETGVFVVAVEVEIIVERGSRMIRVRNTIMPELILRSLDSRNKSQRSPRRSKRARS